MHDNLVCSPDQKSSLYASRYAFQCLPSPVQNPAMYPQVNQTWAA